MFTAFGFAGNTAETSENEAGADMFHFDLLQFAS